MGRRYNKRYQKSRKEAAEDYPQFTHHTSGWTLGNYIFWGIVLILIAWGILKSYGVI
jgi:hypothetical protein